MSLLDVTIVNVAHPVDRGRAWTPRPRTVQWVVSGYALTFGLTLVAGGRLGDAYGRRRMMLVGLAGFVVASAAVGLAPERRAGDRGPAAQGAAAGLLTPQNSGLIQQLFHGAERGRAFGIFGLTVSLSSAPGPGDRRADHPARRRGERLALAVPGQRADRARRAGRSCRGSCPARARCASATTTPGSTSSAPSCSAGVLCLLYPHRQPRERRPAAAGPARSAPRRSPGRSSAGSAGPSRRGAPPLLDVALLRQLPGYANGLAVGTLYFIGFTGIFLVLSVYLQDGLGYSAAADRAAAHPVRRSARRSPHRSPAGWSRDRPPDHGGALVVMMTGRPAGRPARARQPRAAVAVVGAVPAARGPRRRWRGLAEHHPDAWPRCRPGWAGPPAAPCRPVSGSGPRSAPRC